MSDATDFIHPPLILDEDGRMRAAFSFGADNDGNKGTLAVLGQVNFVNS